MLDGHTPMEAVQPVRVKYIKFTSAMDVALLELIQLHKPISAKHGTRLAMWERVARDFGAQVFDNPLACKWQICRDRGNLLLRWFDDGRFDKLFKDDSEARNRKKEALLQSLRQASSVKQGSTSPPSPTKSSSAASPTHPRPQDNTQTLHEPKHQPTISLIPRHSTMFSTASSPHASSTTQRSAKFPPSPSHLHFRPQQESSPNGVPSPPIHLPSLKAQAPPAQPAALPHVGATTASPPIPSIAHPTAMLSMGASSLSSAARTKSLHDQQQSPNTPFKAEGTATTESHQVNHLPALGLPYSHRRQHPSPPHLPSLVHPNHPSSMYQHHSTAAALTAPSSRKRRGPPFDGSSSGLDATAAQLLRIVEQKLQVDMDMRRRDQQLRAQELNMQHQLIDYLDTSRHTRRQRRRIIRNSGASSTDVAVNDEDDQDDQDDGGAAARLLELLKHKMQFDMAHHAAEMELRADEVELQRRVLAFLARC
ncbi:hypothetical protein, variant [Aphanomyces invadans]|uniref:Uncharacterized protein n=1 Tax=Aphanomyces invadans TaxID=157072 RepID=A0A024UU10_9STRA|nr:hypothetical protein, variant [Aphanomyces invadans]ETW09158.1 hypothetical protein, variant [Aphanomyces invadans]|eukprot:XP_008862963.1 hypothetical protein, variant [Aphanomyces invadans]